MRFRVWLGLRVRGSCCFGGRAYKIEGKEIVDLGLVLVLGTDVRSTNVQQKATRVQGLGRPNTQNLELGIKSYTLNHPR